MSKSRRYSEFAGVQEGYYDTLNCCLVCKTAAQLKFEHLKKKGGISSICLLLVAETHVGIDC